MPAKTNSVAVKDGFEFLGFTIYHDSIRIQTKKLDRVVEAIRDQMKSLGASESTLQLRVAALSRINAVVRGFRNFLFLSDEEKNAEQLNYLDGRCEQMAHQYLPAQIRDAPASLCRDRFYDRGVSRSLRRPVDFRNVWPWFQAEDRIV